MGRSGAGLLNTFETVKALSNSGYDVYLILSEYIDEKRVWNKLTVKDLWYIKTYHGKAGYIVNSIKFILFGARKLKKHYANIEFDFLYMPMLYMWSGIVLGAYRNSRSFVVLHDVIPHTGMSRYVTRKFLGFARKASDVIVHSPKYVKQAVKILPKPESRVHYYPLGDHTAYYNTVTPQKKALSYSDEKINFLFFGTIMEYKGIGILIDAYASIRKSYDNITLNIVGTGNLAKYKKQLDMLPDVTVINRFIDDAEVKSVFTGSNIITVTPYINATQSGPIILAMGYRSMIITSDCYGLKNQVKNGKYGLIFEAGNVDDLIDKMEEAINNSNLREMLIEEAYLYNQRNSWTNSISKMMNGL